jgi:hypothetical protein
MISFMVVVPVAACDDEFVFRFSHAGSRSARTRHPSDNSTSLDEIDFLLSQTGAHVDPTKKLCRRVFDIRGQATHGGLGRAGFSRVRRHTSAASREINTRVPTLNVTGIKPNGLNL